MAGAKAESSVYAEVEGIFGFVFDSLNEVLTRMSLDHVTERIRCNGKGEMRLQLQIRMSQI